MKRLLIITALFVLVLGGCAVPENESDTDGTTETTQAETDAQQDSLTDQEMSENVEQLKVPSIGEEIVVITTNKGVIKARLFPDLVPETYKNFVYHTNEGNYDGTIFHRVIEDFMIQGGDIDNQDGVGGYSYKGPGTTINEEYAPELRHHRGALSMARTAVPNTTGSQFFIVHPEGGARFLDDQYSVFGQVFEGIEIVDEIASVETGGADKPVEDVVMESVELTEYAGE